MPLVQTRGAASAQGFGEFAQASPAIPYIEDVFSCFLYTGTGAAQTITNDIDLAGKGGLVWIKNRPQASDFLAFDTARGIYNRLLTYDGDAQASQTDTLTEFNSTGFTIGTGGSVNNTPNNYASWTWRKQPKYFDIQTWTGNATNRTIAHNLGSVPGSIIVKRTDTPSNWAVYHRSLANTQYLVLNSTAVAATGATWWNSTTPTSAVFSLGTDASVNASGGTYVAYIYAHDAGGFGLAGTDNVISCGTFTTNASGNFSVNLGYEPQWVLAKQTTGAANNWAIFDNMRGMSNTGVVRLIPNSSAAETNFANSYFVPTATGFFSNSGGFFDINETVIYIAIRRGPMKVPTVGTSVFAITTAAGTSPAHVSSFSVDVALRYQITGGDPTLQARLVGPRKGFTDYTFSESSDSNVTWDYQNGMFTTVGENANQYGWLMKRAPSFMDVVCYSGTGSATTQSHNLGAVPELMIVKRRNTDGFDWIVYSSPTGNNNRLLLNATVPAGSATSFWNDTTPTSSVFTLGNNVNVNGSTGTYIAYLFATAAGVSKVGSYTGNGSTQTINCGFTGGARFVIIKRTDSTGDWYVYDTDRGMTVLTNPYFFLNTAAAQVVTLGSVTTVTTGFALNSTILATINVSGGSYIFLAIA